LTAVATEPTSGPAPPDRDDDPAHEISHPGDAVGPYVYAGDGWWVDARHTVAVSERSTDPDESYVTLNVTDPDTAGPLVVVAHLSTDEVVAALTEALTRWAQTTGEAGERGRLRALDSAGEP
jgi:hypothetical protein